MIHHGDCLDVMAAMEPESVDAVVTDPPYDLTDVGRRFMGNGGTLRPDGGPRSESRSGGFMGKVWDGTGIAFRPETWAACLRVAKPSAYLLAFGGTRTVHRMTVAIEDAGWIIRDMLVWAYASGFPKSKASLKPAWEPIVMARKPGPLRELAIDACRIPTSDDLGVQPASRAPNRILGKLDYNADETWEQSPAGRWPANLVLTDPIFDGGWDGVVGGGAASENPAGVFGVNKLEYESGAIYGNGRGIAEAGRGVFGYGDSGTYSRFFLIPKADRADREPVLGGLPDAATTSIVPAGGSIVFRCLECQRTHPGLDRHTRTVCARCGSTNLAVTPAAMDGTGRGRHPTRSNVHPTVKPTELMRHLVRLVTPTGGIVLDPFAGSGSTLLAAEMEGFEWIGIEKEAEYVAIAEARLNGTQRGLGLPA